MFRRLRSTVAAAGAAVVILLPACAADSSRPAPRPTPSATSAGRPAPTTTPEPTPAGRPDFRPAAEMPVAMPALPADVRAAAVTGQGETTFSVTMTTSIGGMVNVSAVDPEVTRAGAADQSHLARSRPACADTLERTSRAAIRLPDGRGVLGTSRGELVVIDPLARAMSVIALPAAAGGAQLDVLDLTYDAPTDRLLVATRSPQVGTGAGQVLALRCLTAAACPGGRDGARSWSPPARPPPITPRPGRSAPGAVPCSWAQAMGPAA